MEKITEVTWVEVKSKGPNNSIDGRMWKAKVDGGYLVRFETFGVPAGITFVPNADYSA